MSDHARRRRRPRSLPRRLLEYLLALPILVPVASTVMLFDGPAWRNADGALPASPEIRAIERAYAPRMGDTPLVVLDVPTLVERYGADPERLAPALTAHANARLQGKGIFLNTLWSRTLRSLSEPKASPFALTTWLAGGPHGGGALGYLDFGPAVLVTPASSAITTENIEHGYAGYPFPLTDGMGRDGWSYLILTHELEHAVDAARTATLAGRLHTRLTALFPAQRHEPWPHGDGVPPLLTRTAQEIFADLGAAVQLLKRDGRAALPHIRRLAHLRALGPLWTASRGRAVYLGHFTAFALHDLIADVEAGRTDLLDLQGQALSAALDRRRDHAIAEMAGIDWLPMRAGHDGDVAPFASAPDIFAAAGTPTRWTSALRRTVAWYQQQLRCMSLARAPRVRAITHPASTPRPQARPICLDINQDGPNTWRPVPRSLVVSATQT